MADGTTAGAQRKKARTAAKALNDNHAAAAAGAYTWEQLHRDLDSGNYAGVPGSVNAPYFGLAELRVGADLDKIHSRRSPDEFYVQSLDKLLHEQSTRRNWGKICTFDPLGMYADRPTMAACQAQMNIPELAPTLEQDGKIVNPDGSVNIVKCAVDYAWNLPLMAERLEFKERDMREKLYKYTQNPMVLEEKYKVYLPPVGGLTVYFIGDIYKLADHRTEVAVRVHDQCTGSDVFGTDICTCRPYLVFALEGAIKCAQRGGVGIIVYFQKEGRSLGEVTKFRVYNARMAQVGGDRAEKYFYQTESIAGIRDARFQQMMPDVLHWLGIQRIDWLLSMSSDKYDAIVSQGIEVSQRVSLPDAMVPKNAHVEINAKISAGYHTDRVDNEQVVDRLRGLRIIRERCGAIFEMAKRGETRHFNLHLENLEPTVDFVIETIRANYPDLKVPYHSRWRHFPDGAIQMLESKWDCGPRERARRKVDLATISVLLDAGAGPNWKYTNSQGQVFLRSEGIAIATFDMFRDGLFSSDRALRHRVNAQGLELLTKEDFYRGMQHSESNPMLGIDGRFELLKRLAKALDHNKQFFGRELFRPGNMVDYVLSHSQDKRVSIKVLWKAVIEGFESIWPETLSGIRRGDIWIYNPLKKAGEPASDMVPFHKLSQWLLLSLLEPIEELGIQFYDMHKITGLAEYRNGGLFIDMGVLEMRDKEKANRPMDVGAEFVVEWRALTVALLDLVAHRVREKLRLTEEEMPLTKVLQGGTWAAGRVIAKQKRSGGSPPIDIRSDGCVF